MINDNAKNNYLQKHTKTTTSKKKATKKPEIKSGSKTQKTKLK